MTAVPPPDAQCHVHVEWPKEPRLSQLAGAEAANRFGETLAADLLAYKTGGVSWSDIDPGCLLYGPPGTGKTTPRPCDRRPMRCGVHFHLLCGMGPRG